MSSSNLSAQQETMNMLLVVNVERETISYTNFENMLVNQAEEHFVTSAISKSYCRAENEQECNEKTI